MDNPSGFFSVLVTWMGPDGTVQCLEAGDYLPSTNPPSRIVGFRRSRQVEVLLVDATQWGGHRRSSKMHQMLWIVPIQDVFSSPIDKEKSKHFEQFVERISLLFQFAFNISSDQRDELARLKTKCKEGSQKIQDLEKKIAGASAREKKLREKNKKLVLDLKQANKKARSLEHVEEKIQVLEAEDAELKESLAEAKRKIQSSSTISENHKDSRGMKRKRSPSVADDDDGDDEKIVIRPGRHAKVIHFDAKYND